MDIFYRVLQQTTDNVPPFMEEPLNCNCNAGQDFINYWTSAGHCCDNLRMSIWLIFNTIFLVISLSLGIAFLIEKRRKRLELEDFTIREDDHVFDSPYSSFLLTSGEDTSASSIARPLFRDD